MIYYVLDKYPLEKKTANEKETQSIVGQMID